MKKITLKTANERAAKRIVSGIIWNAQNDVYKTWSYEKISLVVDGKDYDAIFHNRPQYVDNLDKHVWFIPGIINSNVIFQPIISEGYELTDELASLHTGRLLEMLMTYHYDEFTEIIVK